jgi:RNA polymerase sigma factor (sigma-70 family)
MKTKSGKKSKKNLDSSLADKIGCILISYYLLDVLSYIKIHKDLNHLGTPEGIYRLLIKYPEVIRRYERKIAGAVNMEHIVSLDNKNDFDEEEYVRSGRSLNPLDILIEREKMEIMHGLLSRLTGQERTAIKLRYLPDSKHRKITSEGYAMTYEQIGYKMGRITRERVRQILRKAEKKLRESQM